MIILPPKGDTTRPITDRVKESIFDVLYKYNLIEDKLVADLFCGTGSFGLEAISRGAKTAVFIDMDKRAIEILRKNIAKAGFVAQSKVVCANAFKVGAPNSLTGEKYSLIFVDPPYQMSRETGGNSRIAGLLQFLPEQMTEAGVVVVRTEKHVNILDNYSGLSVIDRRQWGSMNVSFLQNKIKP